MALEAYRSVLRAARVAFQGDPRIFSAACTEAHSRFAAHRALDPENPDTEQKIGEAKEVARLLRQNLVQGEPVDGNENRYQLRLHPETERGDNESIKLGTSPAGTQEGCCGGASRV